MSNSQGKNSASAIANNAGEWVKASNESNEFGNGPSGVGNEYSISNLRLLDEETQKGLFFKDLRACDLHAIRSLLQANRNLLNSKMFGYEGSDVYGIIKNSKTKRCYTYTGQEKDGYFYPLHVATEAGHKNLTILLVKAGSDVSLLDYRGNTAEDKCTGNAQHAFYELRGLRFEPRERYEGKLDRQGKKIGQGTIYFKPEGYLSEERKLYRGSFKNNLYHGHGTLYYPGTDVHAYIGRFKEGLRHGRGIEFDLNGKKVYQGTFREDKREGRGEEFIDDIRVYRGEFSNNTRHGFGIAYFTENSYYFGRYENGMMTGVGINCLPTGDRFEGMFINNKPEGAGSYYERDPYTGNYTGQHAIFQLGRRVKDSNIPFTPTVADLPDDSNKHIFVEIMNSHKSPQSFEVDDDLLSNDVLSSSTGNAISSTSATAAQGGAGISAVDGNDENKSKRNKSAFFHDERLKNSWSKSDWWKVQLGKYLRVTIKEARLMGLFIPEAIYNELCKVDENANSTKTDEAEEAAAESDEEVDELMGYHFLGCTTLFVAYVYVNSGKGYLISSLIIAAKLRVIASKVFEDRLVNKGLVAEFRDFEAVYHLVIDAVDTYNERWEQTFREQQQQQQLQEIMNNQSSEASSGNAPNHSNSGNNIGSRRMVFMTEKEKKEELIMKQRAELAIKKGTAELDPAIEKHIGMEVLEALEAELTKLLLVDGDDSARNIDNKIRTNLPISRKSIQDNILVNHTQFGGGSLDLFELGNSATNTTTTTNQKTAGSAEGKSSSNNATNNSSGIKPIGDINAVNLEDLFDVENFENSVMNGSSNNFFGESTDTTGTEEHSVSGAAPMSNEFAAELLYIMKTSISLS